MICNFIIAATDINTLVGSNVIIKSSAGVRVWVSLVSIVVKTSYISVRFVYIAWTLTHISTKVLWWRWRWWISFVVWLPDERSLALFPVRTNVRDLRHRESSTCLKEDLNLCRTWVPTSLNEGVQQWWPLDYDTKMGREHLEIILVGGHHKLRITHYFVLFLKA